MESNRFGLSRNLPADVKRQVRQRCGFGCIICGSAIIQYHHFDPEFADAQAHIPEGITLLCGRCHDKVHKQMDSFRLKGFDKNPKCRIVGYAHDDFLFQATDKVDFQIGGANFKRRSIIQYDDIPLIEFAIPNECEGPITLSANLETYEGESLFTVEENEWRVGVDHFDVESSSNCLVIRKKLGDVVLRMLVKNERIVFDKLHAGYKGFRLSTAGEYLEIRSPKGAKMCVKCPNIHARLKLRSTGSIAI